jgi:phenylpyruvate tautomerase PptA (4-oxalocrotonate tautomerase family)
MGYGRGVPIVKVTYSGMAIDRPATAAGIREVMREALAIPSSDGPVLFHDLPADAFQASPGGARVVVEVLMFPGRTEATKAALIAGLTRAVAGGFGIPATEILLAILEPALDSWGIRGGQQASQVYR